MTTLRLISVVLLVVLWSSSTWAQPQTQPKANKPSLKDELSKLKIPPAWMNEVQTKWDTNRPWSEARIEIRRLLGAADTAPQGVKLTWIYYQKKDIGDGHELPMYLFLSGNYTWALVEYEKFVKERQGKGAMIGYLSLASLYMHFGEYDKAKTVLEMAGKDLPKDPWQINAQANIHNLLGDLHAEIGDTEKAKQHYSEAIRLYPTSNQPYGRHLLKRNAEKVQSKMNVLTMAALSGATLKDGSYSGKSIGYTDKVDIEVTVKIQSGKIADISVKHDEKIDLNSTKIIPQRIIEKQSLQVDVVTGATVTSDAVIDGAFKALQQAGLK